MVSCRGVNSVVRDSREDYVRKAATLPQCNDRLAELSWRDYIASTTAQITFLSNLGIFVDAGHGDREAYNLSVSHCSMNLKTHVATSGASD